MTKTSESKWRALIKAQEKSGQTVRDFAESRGITPTTLYWWRSELKRRVTKLVPVEVVEQDIVVDHRDGDGPGFELEVDRKMTLRIPAGFDAAELRRLLSALRC